MPPPHGTGQTDHSVHTPSQSIGHCTCVLQASEEVSPSAAVQSAPPFWATRVTTNELLTTPLGPHGSLHSPSATHEPMQSTVAGATVGVSIVAVSAAKEENEVEISMVCPESMSPWTSDVPVPASASGTLM